MLGGYILRPLSFAAILAVLVLAEIVWLAIQHRSSVRV